MTPQTNLVGVECPDCGWSAPDGTTECLQASEFMECPECHGSLAWTVLTP